MSYNIYICDKFNAKFYLSFSLICSLSIVSYQIC